MCPGAGQVSESSRRLPFFATGLIAAKPEKPCDGGVFGVFYLLLKKERNEAGRAADGLLAPKPGALLGGQSAQPAATKAPRKARPCPGFCCCPHPPACAGFATGLIADKPQKPCDGGVFGAFYLLLKKERNEAGRAADGLLAPKPGALLGGQSAQPAATKAPRKARPCPGFCCCPHPTVCAGFATGLIAAKPVKPCDGGVFGAFYLLLKKERLATGAAGAAAKSFLQAARWRPCETAGQRAAFCHERRLP